MSAKATRSARPGHAGAQEPVAPAPPAASVPPPCPDQPTVTVERPLWRALAGYRLLTAAYAVGVFVYHHQEYGRPLLGACYLAVLVCWTLGTLGRVSSAQRCTRLFLVCDVALALTGILLTPLADSQAHVNPSLPTVWVAGSVLAVAVKSGWRLAATASLAIGVASIVEAGGPTKGTVHNTLLVTVASIGIGYVVEVARTSERALTEALRVEAAVRERERLARDIHDNVLQVLAMVQRRGAALGGEAAELGRLAGEQEVALRSLVSGGVGSRTRGDPVPVAEAAVSAPSGRPGRGPQREETRGETVDLGELLAARATSRISFAGPGTPTPLPGPTAHTVDAAVGAALDNVREHVGEDARTWILLEDEPDALLVTVRDDGPGIRAGRLAAAEAEGRMGVSLSILGRLREVGGSAELVSTPGQGTEVELKVPK